MIRNVDPIYIKTLVSPGIKSWFESYIKPVAFNCTGRLGISKFRHALVGYFEFLVIVEHLCSVMNSKRDCCSTDLRQRGIGENMGFSRAIDEAVSKADRAAGVTYCLFKPDDRFYNLLITVIG